MTGRLTAGLVFSALLLAAEDPAEIVRRSVQADQSTLEKAKDYSFQYTRIERDLDASGKVKSTETRTYDVLILYGREFRKLVARDGAPLSEADRRKEDEKLQKALDERRNESGKDRAKRQAKAEEEEREFRRVASEIPDACTLTLLGEEQVGGRPAYVIKADPRPGYKPKVGGPSAKLLTKMRGKLWIDKGDYHWAKLETEAIDTISFGMGLARIGPGTRLEIEQMRVNEEIWAPSQIRIRLDARLALVKKFRKELEVTYRDYRKFQTDSRIVAVGTEPRP